MDVAVLAPDPSKSSMSQGNSIDKLNSLHDDTLSIRPLQEQSLFVSSDIDTTALQAPHSSLHQPRSAPIPCHTAIITKRTWEHARFTPRIRTLPPPIPNLFNLRDSFAFAERNFIVFCGVVTERLAPV